MIKKILAQFLSLSEKNVGNFVKKSLELLFGNGPIQWRGSASMGFSKSRVEDEWLGETHTSTSDSLDWHSWKIEKVASGGWELASGGWVKLEIDNVLVME